jgi:hypothetical protein
VHSRTMLAILAYEEVNVLVQFCVIFRSDASSIVLVLHPLSWCVGHHFGVSPILWMGLVGHSLLWSDIFCVGAIYQFTFTSFIGCTIVGASAVKWILSGGLTNAQLAKPS